MVEKQLAETRERKDWEGEMREKKWKISVLYLESNKQTKNEWKWIAVEYCWETGRDDGASRRNMDL